MSEFEDKLNKILSSPEEMEKIMGMARSLSGSLGTSPGGDAPSRPEDGEEAGSLTSALGNIDPKLFRLLGRALGEYSSSGSDKAALLKAIKPYLKEEKRQRMDKAAEIIKIAHIAKIALSEFSGGGDDV